MATAAVVAPTPVPLSNANLDSVLAADVVADNLQDLLRRKREIEKNKSKYHLTEADAQLLLTNAQQYTFQDGQVILEEGHENNSVYRIKSGRVALTKEGRQFCEMSTGWFFGETLLLHDNKGGDFVEASLVAVGPVTIAEVNIPFVKKLFEADRMLALKFYRNLASKLSAIFYAISGNLMSPCLVKSVQKDLQSQPSTSSLSSDSSTGSEGTGSGSGSGVSSPSTALPRTGSAGTISHTPARGSIKTLISCPNVPAASVAEAETRRRRIQKRRSSNVMHAPFKVYTLESDGKGVRTARLKNKKIKIISEAFGFRHKTTIQFSKIKNVVRTSEVSVTVIFDPLKAKTLFFKAIPELEEFLGLTLPLIESSANPTVKASPGTPLSHPKESPEPSRLKFSSDNYLLPLDPRDDEDRRELDKDVIRSLGTKLELKRGDVLLEEGDLFQRIYTVTKGTCDIFRGDRLVSTMKEGEVVGEASLLHLRPLPCTIKVSSETATVLVIPAHKLNELINSNPVIAVRVYKKIAGLVEGKIEKVLQSKQQLATELCPENAKHIPGRLNL